MLCFTKLKRYLIEVAYFISNRLDAAGAEEDMQKGKAPKEHISAYVLLGHKMKNLMTLIIAMGSYLFILQLQLSAADIGIIRPAHNGLVFYLDIRIARKQEEEAWQFLRVQV